MLIAFLLLQPHVDPTIIKYVPIPFDGFRMQTRLYNIYSSTKRVSLNYKIPLNPDLFVSHIPLIFLHTLVSFQLCISIMLLCQKAILPGIPLVFYKAAVSVSNNHSL